MVGRSTALTCGGRDVTVLPDPSTPSGLEGCHVQIPPRAHGLPKFKLKGFARLGPAITVTGSRCATLRAAPGPEHRAVKSPVSALISMISLSPSSQVP